MKISLEKWAQKNFDPAPAIRTIRLWIKAGKIYPTPEKVGRRPGWEIIVARLVADGDELGPAATELNELRESLAVPVRTAAFTTRALGDDAVRLARLYDAGLVLLDDVPGVGGDELPPDVAAVLNRSSADVAILVGSDAGAGDAVFVPFGGSEHDWAAVELGAWLASASGAPLRLVGTRAEPGGRRDASRLLADAALAVQRVVGVASEPILAEPSAEGLVAAVEPASLVVVGISVRWRREGIGSARRALVRDARPPTLLVHRGPRPGGLAPRESGTRFTWSIQPQLS